MGVERKAPVAIRRARFCTKLREEMEESGTWEYTSQPYSRRDRTSDLHRRRREGRFRPHLGCAMWARRSRRRRQEERRAAVGLIRETGVKCDPEEPVGEFDRDECAVEGEGEEGSERVKRRTKDLVGEKEKPCDR